LQCNQGALILECGITVLNAAGCIAPVMTMLIPYPAAACGGDHGIGAMRDQDVIGRRWISKMI
jgi:hypothetical protein